MSWQQVQGKRGRKKQIRGDDGWTVVASSGYRKMTGVAEATHLRDAKPSRTVDGMTTQTLLAELGNRQREWEKTSCAKNLEHILGLREWDVREAVCIGIGSFSLDWEHRRRSLWQLVLFTAVVKTLQRGNTMPPITLYAQEPAFTDLDSAFLAALNISVLTSDIESHIASSSFVFAPFVDWNLLIPVFLKDKDPELYIGNEILDNYSVFVNTPEKANLVEDCNERGKRFAERRERRRMPQFEKHGSALEGLMIYWVEKEQ